jgi:DNA (cytosine-5)-methyltransferase 1
MNIPPSKIWDSIQDRVETKDQQHVDLYVCGFPCQTFSQLGNEEGLGGGDPRGNVFFSILKYIQNSQPKCFLLENVAHLESHNKGKTLKFIVAKLEQDNNQYNVQILKLSPDHIGFPHRRNRLFIIGVHKSLSITSIKIEKQHPDASMFHDLIQSDDDAKINEPTVFKPLPPGVARNLAWVRQKTLESKGANIDKEDYIVDLGTSPKFYKINKNTCMCPCLRRNNRYYYLTARRRFLTPMECLRFQGFDDNTERSLRELNLTHHEIREYAGNSICVPLLRCLLEPLVEQLVDQLSIHAIAASTTSTTESRRRFGNRGRVRG